MKKGCFFKAVFIIILLVGIGHHFYVEYVREFLEENNEELINLAYESLLDEIKQIPSSDYADSLKFIVTGQLERLQNESVDRSQKEIDDVINSIRNLLKDNELELEEYEQIKKIIEDYEGSETFGD